MSDQPGIFWRRLNWRLRRQSYIQRTPAAERLAWVARVGPAGEEPEDQRTLAHIADISLGGIVLSVSQKLDSGTLLRIQVQNANGEKQITLMVRVIQVIVKSKGNILLSCCFAKELSDEELREFGAERMRPSGGADIRAWVRFPCEGESLFHSVLAGEHEKCRARVLNISAGGVALLSPRKLDIGTLLHLDLVSAHNRRVRIVNARVVHQAAHNGNQWVLGCTFIADLSDEDVKTLL